MKVTWLSRQTACIHGTELVWRRSFMVRSWRDRVKSWYGVDVIWYAAGVIPEVTLCGFCVHCTLYSRIHLADFMFVFARKKSANSPYGVKKISIKWLWPVKVTLEIIKCRPKVFCGSCDEYTLKWDKKICQASSLSFRNEWVYSRLSVWMVSQYLLTSFEIYKNWTFCVLDVLHPGRSVTGRLVTGRFVFWTFCILDIL